MAGMPGRSGGHNRTKKSIEDVQAAIAPAKEDRARAEADWYIRDHTDRYTVNELFDILADKLDRYGITTKDDGMVLSFLAQQYHILQEAHFVYQRDGIEGVINRVPIQRVITDAQKEITILLREFCLTPTTRGKKLAEEKDDDPLAALFNFTH